MNFGLGNFKTVFSFPSKETWLGQLHLAIYFKKTRLEDQVLFLNCNCTMRREGVLHSGMNLVHIKYSYYKNKQVCFCKK